MPHLRFNSPSPLKSPEKPKPIKTSPVLGSVSMSPSSLKRSNSTYDSIKSPKREKGSSPALDKIPPADLKKQKPKKSIKCCCLFHFPTSIVLMIVLLLVREF